MITTTLATLRLRRSPTTNLLPPLVSSGDPLDCNNSIHHLSTLQREPVQPPPQRELLLPRLRLKLHLKLRFQNPLHSFLRDALIVSKARNLKSTFPSLRANLNLVLTASTTEVTNIGNNCMPTCVPHDESK